MLTFQPRRIPHYKTEIESFEKQLDHLTVSKERIWKATLSVASLASCGGAQRAIELIAVHIKEPVGAERRVTLFYLLDSIVQYAHKDRMRHFVGRSSGTLVVYLQMIESHLKEFVDVMGEEYESYYKAEKVLELWRDREIFPAEKMQQALSWLHEHSEKYAQEIEDEALRLQDMIPHYVRQNDGPQCRRVMISNPFVTLSQLLDKYSISGLEGKHVPKYKKEDWEKIDAEIATARKSSSKIPFSTSLKWYQ